MSKRASRPYLGSLGVSMFDGKTVLVTGSARGIGQNIALGFGLAGAQVAIADVNHDAALNVVTELSRIGVVALPFVVDLAQDGTPTRLVEDVVDRLGALDILVNNARGGERRNQEIDSERDWHTTTMVCLQSAHFLTKAAIVEMNKQGGGAVVNIGSISAFYVSGESAAYHAAKAGLAQLTRYFAAHAGSANVRVNAVHPGFIVQDEHSSRFESEDNIAFRRKAERCHPLRRVGRAADVTDAVLFLCSDAARFITGQNICVDGGLNLRDAWTVASEFSN